MKMQLRAQSFILQVGGEGAFRRLLGAPMLTLRGAIFLTHGFSRMTIPISFTLAYKLDQGKKIITGSTIPINFTHD